MLRPVAEVDRGRWAALAESAAVPNPYFHPDFVLAAAAAFGDGVELLVAGDWAAALPVHRARRWRGLPVPATSAWMHDQCFLGTPLLATQDDWEPLLRALPVAGLFGEVDLATRPGALPAYAVPFGAYERAAVKRRPEPTYLEGRVSGKHRRANRRLGRELAAELGGEPALVDHAGSPEAVDRFLDLEAAGWKGARGTALSALPGGREFLHAVCRGFSARGALQLLFLAAGERVAAARINLIVGDELFCFKIAFDESLKRYSPGLQMELAMLEHFHADPTVERMDSCADPGAEMFNRLWPDRKALGGILVPRGRAMSPAVRVLAAQISRRRAN